MATSRTVHNVRRIAFWRVDDGQKHRARSRQGKNKNGIFCVVGSSNFSDVGDGVAYCSGWRGWLCCDPLRMWVYGANSERHPDFRNLNFELHSLFCRLSAAIICSSCLCFDSWLCYNMHAMHFVRTTRALCCWNEFTERTTERERDASSARTTETDWRTANCSHFFPLAFAFERRASRSMNEKVMKWKAKNSVNKLKQPEHMTSRVECIKVSPARCQRPNVRPN